MRLLPSNLEFFFLFLFAHALALPDNSADIVVAAEHKRESSSKELVAREGESVDDSSSSSNMSFIPWEAGWPVWYNLPKR
jgi:hypothetical protein